MHLSGCLSWPSGLDLGCMLCMTPCMATKTISLEIDAYERLRGAKLGERESFSAVVRRAVFPPPAHSSAAILQHLDGLPPDVTKVPEACEYWTKLEAEDTARPRVSGSPWEQRGAS